MRKTKFRVRRMAEFKTMPLEEKRSYLLQLVGLTIGAVTVLWGGYWYFIGSHYVSTDNAYVSAEIAQVTPSVDGTVKSVNVVDTQKVKAGDVLVLIDDIDARLMRDRAAANFAKAKTDVDRTRLDYERRKSLVSTGSVSEEDVSNSENAYRAAKSGYDAAKAALEQAEVDLKRTTVTAPIDGVVAKRDVQIGQKVRAGTQLMVLVPVDNVYVNANFKEVQLRKVTPGQTATLSSDIYGSGVVYHGRVVGLSGGTGSVFSLIPAQNATGNWIKVVQRLPVRIELDPNELAEHPLQVGLSMNAEINISETK